MSDKWLRGSLITHPYIFYDVNYNDALEISFINFMVNVLVNCEQDITLTCTSCMDTYDLYVDH